MSTSTLTIGRSDSLATRLGDYFELTKLRIAVLVLVSVAVSGWVARWGQPDISAIFHAVVGTFLIAASASALNQWMERFLDARMQRTADRPLPSGRISTAEVVTFAIITFIAGVAYLAALVNWTTVWAGIATWVIYVWLYTPLKCITSANTAVGAISGAMPVVMGWTAVGGSLSDIRLAALFLIVFLWQFPHFMAIAWLYRKDYDTAGMKMLTVVEPTGRRAGVQAVLGALALLPVSLVPAMMMPDANAYLLVAFVGGVLLLAASFRFMLRRDQSSARLLLRASLVYLPTVLVMMVLVPWL